MVFTIIVLLLVFSFLVLIHELGHYVVAKWQKIHVEEFGLGYPPRALTVFERWGTKFTLNWIPFGGFVKMEGEDGPNSVTETTAGSNSDAFYAKSALGRLAVIVAGAAVNIVYGVIAFAAVFSVTGIPSGAVITDLLPNGPAAQAGLQSGQVITAVEVDGQRTEIVTASQLRPFFVTHLGKTVTIVVNEQCGTDLCQETRSFPVQLPSRDSLDASNQDQPITGITPVEYTKFYPWYQQIGEGVKFGLQQAYLLSVTILQLLGDMVSNLVIRGVVPQELAGPVGIAKEAHDNNMFGSWVSIVLFSGLISINLGVMNLLPIPALDGGRAVFIILEQIIGRKRVADIEGTVNQYGFIFLIGLMVLITARDIFRVIQGS